VVKFRNACQRPDVFRIHGNRLSNRLHPGIVTLESLIVVLLASRDLLEALRYAFQDVFDAIKPIFAIRHVETLDSTLPFTTRRSLLPRFTRTSAPRSVHRSRPPRAGAQQANPGVTQARWLGGPDILECYNVANEVCLDP
jgi:hypothetical protein